MSGCAGNRDICSTDLGEIPSFEESTALNATSHEQCQTELEATQETDDHISQQEVTPESKTQLEVIATSFDSPADSEQQDAAIPPVVPLDSQFAVPELIPRGPIALPRLEQQPLTLQEAVETGLQCSPLLGVARGTIQETLGSKKVAFSPFLPKINAGSTLVGLSGGTGVTSSGRLSGKFRLAELEAKWTIWDFGRTLNDHRQAKIDVEIAQLRYTRTKQTVVFDVAVAYYNVLLAQSSISVAEDALRRAKEYLRVANNLRKEGEVDMESVLSAQFQVTRAEQLLVRARTEKRNTIAGLNQEMGIDIRRPTQVCDIRQEPIFATTLEESSQLARNNRREIQVARDMIHRAKSGEEAARAEFRPKLKAVGAYLNQVGEYDSAFYSGNAEDDFWGGEVTLGWNIYSGGSRSGKVQKQQGVVAQARAQCREIYTTVTYEVEYAYNGIEEARHQIRLGRSAVDTTTEKLRVVNNKFLVGEASPTDVVSAQTSLTEAQKQYYQAVYALYATIAQLEYAVGTSLP